MPADPITPGLAAAWSNTSPTIYGVPSRFTAVVRAQSNLTLSAALSGTLDGVSLQGTAATFASRAVLVTAQSTTSQNGIYVTSGGGTSVSIVGSFGTGTKVVSGLTANRLYYWAKDNGYNASNGTETLTENGYIAASSSGTLTFQGPASTGQSDGLNEVILARMSLFDAPNEFPVELVVNVTGGTSANTWWQLTSTVTSVGSSPVTFTQITVGSLDLGFEDNPFDNTPPVAATVAKAAPYDNTNPTSVTPGLSQSFVNTTPDGKTPSNATDFDNATPDGKTPGTAAAFNNTPATALVLQGETSPVAGITTPASPTAVDHTATLVAGTNYLVQVGARLAPVTINLPNPGSLAQRIEIADITGQAGTYAITVNGGARDIETAGQTSYTINRNDAVLALSYTGAKWKIL
jgi:hypothetical protein